MEKSTRWLLFASKQTEHCEKEQAGKEEDGEEKEEEEGEEAGEMNKSG